MKSSKIIILFCICFLGSSVTSANLYQKDNTNPSSSSNGEFGCVSYDLLTGIEELEYYDRPFSTGKTTVPPSLGHHNTDGDEPTFCPYYIISFL